MQTKPAVQSAELRVVVLTAIASLIAQLMENRQFLDMAGDYTFLLSMLSMGILGYLRIYRTKTAIEGILKPKPKSKPPGDAPKFDVDVSEF